MIRIPSHRLLAISERLKGIPLPSLGRSLLAGAGHPSMNGMKQALSLALVIFMLHASLFTPLALAGGPGTTTAQLLKIPISARAIGMGEAYTALADDSSALFWNPAGLAFVDQKEASFMHSSLIESIHYEHFAYAHPGDSINWGSTFSYLGYGSIAGYNDAGQATGNVDAYSYVWNGGVARMINPRLSLGVAGSLIHETLADEGATTLAINAGGIYQPNFHFWDAHYRLGMSLTNLGPGLKFVSERDPLPRKIKFGAAALGVKNKPLNFTMDITVPNDNSTYLSLGSEYWFKNILAMRLGYMGSNDEGKGFRLGFGLKLAGLSFDYAYGGFGDFGATHRLSFTFRFGDKIEQLSDQERVVLKQAKRLESEGNYVGSILAYNEILDQNPSNDHILKAMIGSHEQMLNKELQDAVAQVTGPQDTPLASGAIPSPEQAALADLLPGQDPAAVQKPTPNSPYATPGMDGYDPLSLENLPDVSAVDAAAAPKSNFPARTLTLPSSRANTAQPQNLAEAMNQKRVVSSPSKAATSDDSPALLPGDIYGR